MLDFPTIDGDFPRWIQRRATIFIWAEAAGGPSIEMPRLKCGKDSARMGVAILSSG
jgi:hypothetical protein